MTVKYRFYLDFTVDRIPSPDTLGEAARTAAVQLGHDIEEDPFEYGLIRRQVQTRAPLTSSPTGGGDVKR